MRTNSNTTMRAALALTVALLIGATAQAQTGPQFDLDWFSIDGGGQMFSTSRSLELGGTIGQHDAVQLTSGGGFELVGGFWAVALVGETTPCIGDLNGDGNVDITDLAQLLAHFGMGGATFADGDMNGDGNVDIADLAALLSNFGLACP